MMKTIMLYALSTCPFCKMTKRFFESQNLPFDYVDVDLLEPTEKEKTVQKVQEISGRRAFPVIVIGDKVIVGYDELKIKEALEE
ncbi:MAG: glutaredoxin family protein [Candidatus Caldatribacteriaceae bacterium]